MTDKRPETTDAVAANISVHSALANSGEYNRSPHFLPENQQKVRHVIESICADLPTRNKLLDIGCGTGFIINLTHDLFEIVHGIDITEDMMSQVDLSPGNIELFRGEAEKTPFDDNTYSMVSAYSFLDHVVDYRAILSEAHRVLIPGGVFYTDLNPNRLFSAALLEIEQRAIPDLPHIVQREIEGMLHNGEYYEKNFGIDGATLRAAEPIKSLDHGFDPYELVAAALDVGFSDARFELDWYLGQAKVMHQQSLADSEIVERYLRAALPATDHLFKYIRFVLVK